MSRKNDRVREAGAGQTAASPAADIRVPVATYRLQFNRQFTFKHAIALVPYLHELGISHCYASSWLKARPGSTHGYDIIDHNCLNPEIGSETDFNRFLEVLNAAGMQQILDIVPNHMGVMGSENAWWLDVLENGASSRHAGYFDIDWKPAKRELHNKVLLPLLGDHYGTVLNRGELVLDFDPAAGAFNFHYYKHRFPVDPRTYADILEPGLTLLRSQIPPATMQEFEDLIAQFRQLPGHEQTDPALRKTRQHDLPICKDRLRAQVAATPELAAHIRNMIIHLNGNPDDASTFRRLHALLEQQAWRLAFWKTAADEINYRRFFDINELAGLRMQNPEVFNSTHRLIEKLLREHKLAGLRIDHIDGLFDPAQYLDRLAERLSDEHGIYIVVEKILAAHEHLHEDWPVHGTTGYEFSNLVNGLFVEPHGKAAMNRTYHRFLGHRADFSEILYAAKRRIIKVEMSGELNVLADQLNRISELNPFTRDFTLNSLRHALTEVTACFPVYRTYVTGTPVSAPDLRYIDWAISQAKKHSVTLETSVFDFLRSVLSLDFIRRAAADTADSIIDFVMRYQQYTSPVMAKGLEDTALYRYNRLLSLNEVGSDPDRFGTTFNAFHYLNQERLKHWPDSMLSTSTHDSKRSEDVRARLNVLSEVPAEFRSHLTRWRKINRRLKIQMDGTTVPTLNDEYFLYQTLLGSLPLQPLNTPALDEWRGRIRLYMVKAVKEAKVMTSWSYPHPEYEDKLLRFIDALLGSVNGNPFLDDFIPFARRISHYGLYNSLSQTLLKLTCPGMPDIYQGNELFVFTLTDPDNRNPVDYELRRAIHHEISPLDNLDNGALANVLQRFVGHMHDGRIKFYLTLKTLNLRGRYRQLFQRGTYIPLNVSGSRADHICAFARSDENNTALVIAPRFITRLCPDPTRPPLGEVWADTYIELPDVLANNAYTNIFTRRTQRPQPYEKHHGLPVAALLRDFPAGLLIRHEPDHGGH